jgi:hypothetical protein
MHLKTVLTPVALAAVVGAAGSIRDVAMAFAATVSHQTTDDSKPMTYSGLYWHLPPIC